MNDVLQVGIVLRVSVLWGFVVDAVDNIYSPSISVHAFRKLNGLTHPYLRFRSHGRLSLPLQWILLASTRVHDLVPSERRDTGR